MHEHSTNSTREKKICIDMRLVLYVYPMEQLKYLCWEVSEAHKSEEHCK